MTWTPILVCLLALVGFTRQATAAHAKRDPATGGVFCSDTMCIGALVNGTNIEYVLQTKGVSALGWMAMGFGNMMVGSPIVVMWSNADGTVTLSQRKASEQALPPVDNNPQRIATLSTDLTTASGAQPKFAYSIPTDGNTSPDIIWAYGTENPRSSAPDASFGQHLASGTFTFDLTNTFADGSSLTSPASSPLPSGSSGEGSTISKTPKPKYQKVILAHAVVCAIAFLFVMPSGVLLARYYRTKSQKWFQGHWFIQFAVAGPLVLTGAILAASISKAGGRKAHDTHTQLGKLIFGLYVVQVVIGALIHFIKLKTRSGTRPPQNYIHVLLGLSTIVLAMFEVNTGYRKEWPAATGLKTPGAVRIVWVVWVVVLALAYFVGLLLLKKQFAQEREGRAKLSHSQESSGNEQSGVELTPRVV